MFGLFSKKNQSTTMMDEIINTMYGNPPPPKSAKLDQAIRIAFDELLLNLVSKQDITKIATNLNSGPIPYSTHDLAISIALHFFTQPERISQLREAQMLAKMNAFKWAKEEKLNPMIFDSFENSLYELYKPINTSVDVDDTNDDFSIEQLIQLAERGDAQAQANLGLMYNIGDGVKQDYKHAYYWYEKAAAQGNVNSQFNIGSLYNNGDGVKQDYKQTAFWYEKAAAQGDAEAQVSLGLMYYNGEGFTQDYKKAAYWYEKAAAQGYADAQVLFGSMYYYGQGVTQDFVKAHMWANIGASNGSDSRLRKLFEKDLTPSKLLKAQEMARECLASNYKNCH